MEHGPFRPDTIAADVDFFSVHPYTIYTPDLFPDPMVAERSTYGAAFETTLSRDAGRPVMVQEMGASSAQYSPENIVAFDQVSLYSALGAGANGFLLWCYTDAAPEQYRKVPYLRSPHETQFGLTTWDRQMRPQGLAFQAFSKLVAHMDLQELKIPAADAAIVVPEEWSRTHGDFSRFGLKGPEVTPYVSVAEGGAVNGQEPNGYDGNQWVMSATLSAFILAHRAGLKPALPREATEWDQYPLLLLPFAADGHRSGVRAPAHRFLGTRARLRAGRRRALRFTRRQCRDSRHGHAVRCAHDRHGDFQRSHAEGRQAAREI